MQDYIIVGFSTHRDFNLLSWLIKTVERTKFSHAYVQWYSASADRYLIYQASGLTVNFCGMDIFYKKNIDVAQFTIPITAAEKKQIIQMAIDLAGKPYGMKDLFGIAWVRFMGLFGKKVKNPFSDGAKTYICSELAATILTKIGFKFEDLDTTTPKDIYDKLRGTYGTDSKS